MKKQITINKEWYDKLVKLIDELALEASLNDQCPSCQANHGWISHLLGYIHSLDEHFKGTTEKKLDKKTIDGFLQAAYKEDTKHS